MPLTFEIELDFYIFINNKATKHMRQYHSQTNAEIKTSSYHHITTQRSF